MSEHVLAGPIEPAALTRSGIQQMLIGAVARKPGEIDEKSAVTLVQAALTTYTWAVREQLATRLRETYETNRETFTVHLLTDMINQAKAERLETSIRVAELAYFLATAPLPTTGAKN